MSCGNWWPALDIAGVGGLQADGPVPLAIPGSLVTRITAHHDAAGAVPSGLTSRQLLGLPADCTVCPEREPRYYVMSDALDRPLHAIDREILVKIIGYVCGAGQS